MTEAALALLGDGTQGAYEAALAALREDTREWWEKRLTWEADDYEYDAEPYRPTGADLQGFLETEVNAWYEQRRLELSHRPLIRSQAFGQSLNSHRLEQFARYETHLDRKLQRTLALLLKLQELRRTAAASPAVSAQSVSQKSSAGSS
jgi:hypothetical protein